MNKKINKSKKLASFTEKFCV